MTIRIGTVVTLMTCTLAASCGSSSTPTSPSAEGPRSGSSDIVVTLSPGQRATIEGTRLSLQFTGVPADSRCPADAFCIQLGEAVAVFDASVAAGGQSRIELRTSEGRRSAAVGDYLVVLRELTP
jgi:hypothetical protein